VLRGIQPATRQDVRGLELGCLPVRRLGRVVSRPKVPDRGMYGQARAQSFLQVAGVRESDDACAGAALTERRHARQWRGSQNHRLGKRLFEGRPVQLGPNIREEVGGRRAEFAACHASLISQDQTGLRRHLLSGLFDQSSHRIWLRYIHRVAALLFEVVAPIRLDMKRCASGGIIYCPCRFCQRSTPTALPSWSGSLRA
jgi:hypothetical protein